MVTYGFFNSVGNDRRYNADQISEYFRGLVSDGVYEDVGNALQVLAGDGMQVKVQTGRMLIDCRWLESDAVVTLSLTAAHPTLNRYTAVVVRLDRSRRLMEIAAKDGAAASNPQQPEMADTEDVTEKCLAMVYVRAGTSSVTQSAITDTRANTAVCGWVTGLIKQVDTSRLFLQWETAYAEQYDQWETAYAEQHDQWETENQSFYNRETAAYNEWFRSLTDELRIETYIEQFEKHMVGTAQQLARIPLDMTGYTYSGDDVVLVSVNGLAAVENLDYIISAEGTSAAVYMAFTGGTEEQEVYIRVLKSVIGSRSV